MTSGRIVFMPPIKYLVLDVLKLHKPSVIELGQIIVKAQKGNSVNIRVEEVDERTETVRVIVKGNSINFTKIRDAIEFHGASIHSVDEICLGGELICSER
jgi:hypothetical protein